MEHKNYKKKKINTNIGKWKPAQMVSYVEWVSYLHGRVPT